jgi:hypothetical protein
MNDIKDLLEEINSLTAEVEKLAKSDMYKAEDGPIPPKFDDSEDEKEEAPEAPEAEADEAPEKEEGEDKIEDQAEELEDAAEEGGESLDEVVKALDDEDLQELMAAVQAEMAARKGGEEAAPEAPAPDMDKAIPPMHKAMDDMKKTMDEMKKSLDGLRAENASLKKSAPISRPAAMNRAEVQTMAKSDSVPEMLSKSEVVEYLLNTKAPVSLVQDANWANSPAELRDVYTKAELKGVKIPTKK